MMTGCGGGSTAKSAKFAKWGCFVLCRKHGRFLKDEFLTTECTECTDGILFGTDFWELV